jgi:transcriptional regulator with XRE-family HTH domain
VSQVFAPGSELSYATGSDAGLWHLKEKKRRHKQMHQIRQERARERMTVRGLAKLSEVHHGTISNIERGVHEANVVTLGKIADALGVDIEVLTGERETQKARATEQKPVLPLLALVDWDDTRHQRLLIFERLRNGEITEVVADRQLRELVTADR